MSGSELSGPIAEADPSTKPPRPTEERLPFLWPRARRSFGVVFAAIGVLTLQVALAAFYWIANPAPSVILAPTWDAPILILVLVGWAAVARHRRLGRIDRALLIALSALVFIYFLIGLGQGFALREFGYDVVLRLHLAYVPELFRMMYDAEPLGWFILYCLLLAIGVIVVVAAIYGSIRHVHVFARQGRRRQVGLAAAVLAATGLGAWLFGVSGSITAQAYAQLDMAMHLDKQLNATARRLEMEAARLRNASPFTRPGAERPNILFFVIESYGEVLFTSKDFASFPPWLDQQGEALTRAGYRVASRRMTSPVFGGSSWLAGVSLLCGVRIDNQKSFGGLMGSNVRCLPAFLNDAGYRTVMAAGNIKYEDQAYEHTLPFRQYYIRDDFGYRGPRMGWSFIPDQYVIDFVHRREVAPRLAPGAPAEPLFVAYFLTNSHHPWAVIPPFVDDWSTLGDGSVYDGLQPTEFKNQFVAGSSYRPAYRTSIQYSLQSVLSYLGRLPPGDRSLVIVLGDHQPRRPVGRMKVDPWEVPVHVLSRDPSVMERFGRVGFRPGFAPGPEPASPGGFETFLQDLFAAYAPLARP